MNVMKIRCAEDGLYDIPGRHILIVCECCEKVIIACPTKPMAIKCAQSLQREPNGTDILCEMCALYAARIRNQMGGE